MIEHYQEQLRWEHVKNDSTEDCPPWGALVVKGTEARGDKRKYPVLICDKPGTTLRTQVMINGPTRLRAGGYGRACRAPSTVISGYDPSATPVSGEGYGVKPDSWWLHKGYPTCCHVQGIYKSDKKLLLGTLTPVTTLLCQATGDITGGSPSSSYVILAGAQGSEANAGFTSVPPVVNRSTEKIASGEQFLALWVNSGWEARKLEVAGEGEGGGDGVALYFGRLASALSAQGSVASVNSIVAFDGSTPPSITDADNTWNSAGYPGDEVIIAPTPGFGFTGYSVVRVSRPDIAHVIEGHVYSAFTKDDIAFRMMITRAYQGSMPVNGGILNGSLLVLNFDRQGVMPAHETKPYLFEGEYGAACRAEYDPDFSKFLGIHVYRATWVECPEESPVETESAGNYYPTGGYGYPTEPAHTYYYGS